MGIMRVFPRYLFLPFLRIQNCSLSTPFLLLALPCPVKKEALFFLFLLPIYLIISVNSSFSNLSATLSNRSKNKQKNISLTIPRDRLHRETMDFLRLTTALHSCQNILSEKEQGTFLWRQEVLLSLKDKLFRAVANYLVIEV